MNSLSHQVVVSSLVSPQGDGRVASKRPRVGRPLGGIIQEVSALRPAHQASTNNDATTEVGGTRGKRGSALQAVSILSCSPRLSCYIFCLRCLRCQLAGTTTVVIRSRLRSQNTLPRTGLPVVLFVMIVLLFVNADQCESPASRILSQRAMLSAYAVDNNRQ